MSKKIIDITMTIECGMHRYRSIEDFSFQWLRSFSQGDNLTLSRFEMNSHLGTHIDAPLHFFAGSETVDTIPLDTLCGKAQVVDATGRLCIDSEFIDNLDIHCPRVLFLTNNTHWLKENKDNNEFDNVYFTPEACEGLAKRGVMLIGTDGFNVDRFNDKSRSAHLAILSRKIVILEGIVLYNVLPGDYILYCLPLKLKGLEGAPCRAILETFTGEENL